MEAGPHTREQPTFIQPGRYLRLRLSPTEIFTCHEAKPSPALLGRSPIVTSGRALGGGSSVNCMKTFFWINPQIDLVNQAVFYARAAASDYDDWENVYGNKGWSSKYLIPLLKKVRALQPVLTNLEINMDVFIRQKHINQPQRTLPMASQVRSKCR